jgi:hypothetical protein
MPWLVISVVSVVLNGSFIAATAEPASIEKHRTPENATE